MAPDDGAREGNSGDQVLSSQCVQVVFLISAHFQDIYYSQAFHCSACLLQKLLTDFCGPFTCLTLVGHFYTSLSYILPLFFAGSSSP